VRTFVNLSTVLAAHARRDTTVVSKKKNPAGNEPELSPAFGSEIADGPDEDTETSVLGSIALQ
jgi:hypothetical protein